MNKEVLDKTVQEVKDLEGKAKQLKDENEALKVTNKKLEDEKANIVTKSGTPSIHTTSLNNIEQQAMRNFGCSTVKQLVEVNVGDARYKHVPQEQKQIVLALKEAIDTSRWMAQIFGGQKFDTEKNTPFTKGVLDSYYAKNELVPRLKAFGSTVVGGGDEWVPTVVSSQYVEEYELAKEVAGLWQSIQQPSNPFHLPIQSSKTTARKATENTSFSAANYNTSKLVFNAQKIQEFYLLPEELQEDSAPNFLSLARSEVVNSIRRAEETAQINGDSDGTHQDSDTQAGAADLAEKLWDGLRKLAIANSANGATPAAAAALSDTFLRSMRKAMGRFGVSPRELSWLVSPVGYQQMLGLTDVVTVDKFGPQATILQGALAAYQGIPIVISEFMRDDLNVSGVYDGVTTNNTAVLLVNHRRFWKGVRRPIRMRMIQDMLDQDRLQVAALSRLSFVGHTQGASEVSVVYGVDVTA